MQIKCPSCGHVNIQGEDRCVQCFYSLMQRDIPRPKKDDKIQNVIMTQPISELLTGKDLLVASPSDSVQKVVKVLQKTQKSCVLVYKKKKLVGIISNRDLLTKVADPAKDLAAMKAEEIMTTHPEFVRPKDPIAFVVNKMAMGGFRNVPVLNDDGTPISIIKIKDVLSYLSRNDSSPNTSS